MLNKIVLLNGHTRAQSAGAFSVAWHLVSSKSKGLFNRAIIESGDCDSGLFFRPLADAVAYSEDYASSLGCAGPNVLQCLRALSTDAVFGGDLYGPPLLAPLMPWAAAIDGVDVGLRGVPLDLMRARDPGVSRVPMVIGTNNNEGSIFVAAMPILGFPLPLDAATYQKALQHFFNATTAKLVAAQYDHLDTYEDMIAAMLRDWFFACPARRTARAWAENIDEHAFVYHWSYLPANWIEYTALGDFHASELFFVYHNALPLNFWSAKDNRMSEVVQQYWLSYASDASAHPTPRGAVAWPTYNATRKLNLRLDLPTTVEYDYRGDVCDTIWDRVKRIV